MQSVTDQSCWDLRGPFPMSFANSPKRTCRPHSGNLDNRHVEIVCAASARVNVSVLYQFVDSANWPWPTGVLAASTFRSGGAWLGRSQKMACRLAREGKHSQRFKAINSRTGERQPGRCPFLIGSGNGRQDARPLFARRSVALLRWCRLDLGLFCFGLYLHCARWSRCSPDSLGPLELTWTKTI